MLQEQKSYNETFLEGIVYVFYWLDRTPKRQVSPPSPYLWTLNPIFWNGSTFLSDGFRRFLDMLRAWPVGGFVFGGGGAEDRAGTELFPPSCLQIKRDENCCIYLKIIITRCEAISTDLFVQSSVATVEPAMIMVLAPWSTFFIGKIFENFWHYLSGININYNWQMFR